MAAGYTVRTGEGLRAFRNTTLRGTADSLSKLRQLIAASHIPDGAWPAAASNARDAHAAAVDAMAAKTEELTSLNDGHIDGITATAVGYDNAENASTVVTS